MCLSLTLVVDSCQESNLFKVEIKVVFVYSMCKDCLQSGMVLAWSKIGYEVCERGERISGGGPPIGCKGKPLSGVQRAEPSKSCCNFYI